MKTMWMAALAISLLASGVADAAPSYYPYTPVLPGHDAEAPKDCSYVTFRCPTGGTFRLDTCWNWWELSCYICESTTGAIGSDCEIPDCDEAYLSKINGCSAGLAAPLISTFEPACDVHDLCYHTLGRSKSVCDEDFLWNMERICGIPGLSLVGYPNCFAAASIVYAAVALSPQGQTAYDTDQAWAERECGPDYDGPLFVDMNASGARTGESWADAFTNLQSALAVAEPGDELWVAYGTYTPVMTLADGLVAHWNFDADFDATHGGSAYDGTPVNGPYIDPAGRFGGAVRLERDASQYVDIDSPVIRQAQDHSYSAWYKATWTSIAEGEGGRQFILESRPTVSISYGLRNIDGDGEDTLGQVYTEWNGGSANRTFIINTGEENWHNILVTYDAGAAQHAIYYDGVLKTTMPSDGILDDTVGLIIGAHRDGGRNWDGWIDDVGIWDRVLTTSEIAAIQSNAILAPPVADRTASFQLESGVSIYAGFAGTETNRTDRDWVANPVVLSGDLGLPGDDTDNAYHVVTAVGVDESAFLSGVTIEHGNADGGSGSEKDGGGIYMLNATPTLEHLIVQNCSADSDGGGIYSESSNPIMSDIGILNNSAYNGGGFANRNSGALVVAIRLENNVAEYSGGGIYTTASSPSMSGAYFVGNSARYGGGMRAGEGSAPTFDLVSFENNTASSYGGGIYNNASSPVLDRVLFVGNDGGAGGGAIRNDSNSGPSNPIVNNVVFLGNTAYHGGAIFTTTSGSSSITNAYFYENSGTYGSAIKIYGGDINLAHITCLGNTGGAALMTTNAATATIVNSILWGDPSGECYVDNSTLSVSHSLIQGCGGSGPGWLSSLGNDLGGNLDIYPEFMDMSTGDAHLAEISPAIDAGDETWPGLPETDLEKNPRISGAGVDMGAYEFNFDAVAAPEIPSISVLGLEVHPNPFNPTTTLSYRLKVPGAISLKIYDLKGRLVDVLIDNEHREADSFDVVYQSSLATGVYLARLSSAGEFVMRKLVLLK